MNHQECTSCPNTDKCREVWAEENRGPLTPVGLVVCSAAAFLMPILMAIITGAIARGLSYSENIQIIFSLAGFIIGGFAAAVIVYNVKKNI